MHKFFHVFPLSNPTDHENAARRLADIDKLFDIGCRMLTDARDRTLDQMNLTPKRLSELLALVLEVRKKGTISE